MRRIIVTGATSMIGAALIGEAVREGTEVYALVRPRTGRLDRLPDSGLVHVIGSELDGLKEAEGIPGGCDALYHFAWAGTGRAERDDPAVQAGNIRHTLDAAELAARCGCRKFIGAGSQAEYGPVDGIIGAGIRFSPATAYGAAKYAAGLLSRRLCEGYGMVHIWGRVFSVYGRHDNEGTMLAYAIDRFLREEPAVFSAATQMWDYLYERDAGKIFLSLGKYAGESRAYRIASGRARPLREYIEEVREAFGGNAECVFAGGGGGPLAGLQADVGDLERDIGSLPQTPFREGIAEMIAYRKHLLETHTSGGCSLKDLGGVLHKGAGSCRINSVKEVRASAGRCAA